LSLPSDDEANLPPGGEDDTAWVLELERVTPDMAPSALLSAHAVLCERLTHLAGLLSNTCALVKLWLPDVLWVGVYAAVGPGQPLLLGPFQGPPAPGRVPWGGGIVGSTAMDRAVQIVGEARRLPRGSRVHGGVQSALAVPVVRDGHTLCVLALEATAKERFGLVEVETIAAIASALERRWPRAGNR